MRKEEIPETQEVRRDEALGENVAAVVGGVNLNETDGVIGDFLCDKHVMDFDVLDPGLFGGVIAQENGSSIVFEENSRKS